MEFTLDYHDGIFEVRTSGDATRQGFVDFTGAVLGHKDWRPGGLILVDHSKLNILHLTVSDIEYVSDLMGLYIERLGKAKIAFLVDSDLGYGFIRMWQTYVEIRIKWQVPEEVFRNREDAIAWLKED